MKEKKVAIIDGLNLFLSIQTKAVSLTNANAGFADLVAWFPVVCLHLHNFPLTMFIKFTGDL